MDGIEKFDKFNVPFKKLWTLKKVQYGPNIAISKYPQTHAVFFLQVRCGKISRSHFYVDLSIFCRKNRLTIIDFFVLFSQYIFKLLFAQLKCSAYMTTTTKKYLFSQTVLFHISQTVKIIFFDVCLSLPSVSWSEFDLMSSNINYWFALAPTSTQTGYSY